MITLSLEDSDLGLHRFSVYDIVPGMNEIRPKPTAVVYNRHVHVHADIPNVTQSGVRFHN